jgi:hypothetical protein
VRAEEIEQTRQSKLLSLKRFIAKTNHYLHEHPRAKLERIFESIFLYFLIKSIDYRVLL